MRLILLVAMLAFPLAAGAQTTTPRAGNPSVSNPSAGPASTPAPVPSIPPGTPQTGVGTAPPELMAPGGTQDPTDRSMPNTSLSTGLPPGPGTNQLAPRGSGDGTPALSR